jgi:glycosyltransferase involved in cell wall biosynthesis
VPLIPKRLAFITPSASPSVRGNAITVERIAAGLADRGVRVAVFSLERLPLQATLGEVERFRPELVHGFHATTGGPPALLLARRLEIPAVVTLTGTDVNHDLADAERGPVVRRVLEGAEALVAFHAVIRERVGKEVPAVAPRIRVIAQAVRCPAGAGNLRTRLGLGDGTVIFFQAAGIRPVKHIPSVIPPLAGLARRYPGLRYVLVGPVLDPAEGERVAALLAPHPWAAYLGPVPHGEACALLAGADVALNSSLSEGGMSNAVLEAMSLGVAVLASNIEGNRSVIADGEDGLLYGSEAEFAARAERLIEEPALRARLGGRARRKIAERYPPEAEIEGHLALYRSLLAGR